MSYVQVAEEEGEEPIEVPCEEDGTLLLTTLAAQFPGTCGLKYRNPATGTMRGVRVSDGKLVPPPGSGWDDSLYICVFPKVTENKRKSCDQLENSSAKTKRMETKHKCSDLIVLGLPWKTTEQELRQYFESFGEVLMAQVKKDPKTGSSKGFGFIRFSNYESQARALSKRHLIDGRWCDVRIPNSKDGQVAELNRKVFIGRCTEDITAEDLEEYFSKYGEEVKEKTLITETKASEIKDNHECSDLVILGLPLNITEPMLRQYFEGFGEISKVKIMFDFETRNRFGIIKFCHYKSQLKVISKTHLIDGCVCKVQVQSLENRLSHGANASPNIPKSNTSKKRSRNKTPATGTNNLSSLHISPVTLRSSILTAQVKGLKSCGQPSARHPSEASSSCSDSSCFDLNKKSNLNVVSQPSTETKVIKETVFGAISRSLSSFADLAVKSHLTPSPVFSEETSAKVSKNAFKISSNSVFSFIDISTNSPSPKNCNNSFGEIRVPKFRESKAFYSRSLNSSFYGDSSRNSVSTLDSPSSLKNPADSGSFIFKDTSSNSFADLARKNCVAPGFSKQLDEDPFNTSVGTKSPVFTNKIIRDTSSSSFTDLESINCVAPGLSKQLDKDPLNTSIGAESSVFTNNIKLNSKDSSTIEQSPNHLLNLASKETGEENENVLFSNQAKLYKFDSNAKEWKERAMGDIKILRHSKETKYRIILKQYQVHKIVCNHYIMPEMKLELLTTSRNAVCWYALDCSSGQIEKCNFAVRFQDMKTLDQFKKVFNECLENMKQSLQVMPEKSPETSMIKAATTDKVDIDKSDAIPANFTRYFSSPTVHFPRNFEKSVSENCEKGNKECNPVNDKKPPVIFEKNISFEITNEGIGGLQVFHDPSVSGHQMVVTNHQHKLISKHVIPKQSVPVIGGLKAIWFANDLNDETDTKKRYCVTFKSVEDLNEFQRLFEEGDEVAVNENTSGSKELTDY